MRYLIEKEIFRGGFATVYRGVDVAQRPAAIKKYHKDFLDKEVAQFLTNSVRTHKLLNPESSRFPKLYCHDDRTLVMELIDGIDLSSLGRPPTEVEALATGYQLAICLSEFHDTRPEKPLVHRDVKPCNMIARPNGELVLCDFDLAYIDEQSVDGSDRMIGTPQFYSPEQIQGREVLPISDLFSVGSTLYKLLTGKVVMNNGQGDIEAKVTSALSGLGYGGIKEVIATCWRRGRRYESAEHMTSELANRLRRIGIDPEKSHEVLVGLVAVGN